MGQRTQALIKLVTAKGDVVCGVSLHYQWGYGRVMLMDVLNIAINSDYPAKPFNYDSKVDLANLTDEQREVLGKFFLQLGSKDNAVPNFNYEFDTEYFRIKPYLETIVDVLHCSDNNNGYIELTLVLEDTENPTFLENYSLSFYSINEGEQISFEQYCKESENNQYTTEKFRNAYKAMCNEYGLELVDPVISLAK